MSPWSRSELSIMLCPERVALLRTERALTLRGYVRRLRARRVIQCEASGSGQKPWSGAMDTLGTALPSMIGRGMEVNVILSDHFTQYVLVPWFDKLSDAEELALAQHRFRDMCGNAAESMSVRISPGKRGVPSLASGVDAELLQEMGNLMGRMRIGLRSIRPHLMVAYNSCRASLHEHSAWLVLLEPGSACLAALREGQVAWIRKLRIGDDWKQELPVLLSREAYLADADVALDEVLLWAPHLEPQDIPTEWPWKIRQLTPGCDAGRSPDPGAAHEECGNA